MARPVEYNETVLTRAQEYLDSCIDEEYQQIKTDGKASTTWENKLRVKIPTIEGLAVFLKIARETVYDWKKKYPAFSDIIDDLQAKQAHELMTKGLSGDYNPTIAKVLLTKHGYREGLDQTSDGKALPTPILGNVLSNDRNQEGSKSP